MERAERALLRIERAVERETMDQDEGRDQRLRQKVAAAIAELDHIIEGSSRG